VVSVQESAPSGATRRVPASELAAFLSQPAQAQHLKNLGVEMLVPKVFSQLCPVEAFLSQPAQAQHLKNLGVEMLVPKVFSQLCPLEASFLSQPRPNLKNLGVDMLCQEVFWSMH
jgi:hypothetical protein